MLSAKRVVLVPPKQTGGNAEESEPNAESGTVTIEKFDKIKHKIYDKVHRFIKVISKLAQNDSYDENLRIKSRSGTYLEKTNLVDLLTHSMSIGKVLHGEDDFIALLAKSHVDPELILNENVKSKLINYVGRRSFIPRQTTEIVKNVLNPIPKEQSSKRSFADTFDDDDIEEETEEPEHKRIKSADELESVSVTDDMIDRTRWKI